ncbi:MAG: sigma-70 family RNA polymerase sigma factor [Pseudonocardiaceae bacterium]
MTTSTTSDATPSGTDLLLRIGKGDPATWEEIVRRYGKIVSVTVRSFRLQDADALDAVQMTWLRLAENAHQVQLPERLGGWLTTTARRECLGILRHRVKLASQPFDAVTETVADPSVGPEQRVIDADTAQTLWKLVDELPPRRRTLLRALFTDNPAPYAQIAHIAGISPGAIGPTRARTLRQLRGRLLTAGVEGVLITALLG